MCKLKFITFFMLLMISFYLIGQSGAVPVVSRLVGRGGETLVYTRGHDSKTLDPALAEDEESFKVIANIFEGLVRSKPGTNEIEPCLAEAWRVSLDGMEWTFYLRKNVKFHDGTPFNSEAVRFSIERQMPFRQPSYASFAFGVVDEIKTPDPYTVKFYLKYPYSPFLKNLAMPAAAPMVSPTAASVLGENFGERPVGTGPFRFTSWEKGKRISLQSNMSYWGVLPKPENLIFNVIKNSRLRSLALKLGFSDIIDGITAADARFLRETGYSVGQTPGIDVSYLGFFTDKKPFDNAEIRKAVCLAIDREHIIKDLFHGASFEANGPIPPGILGYSKNDRPIPYDPTAAKELLSRNQFAEGTKITIITYSGSRPYNPAGGEKLAASLQTDLAKVGISADVKAYPWDKYKEALFNKEGHTFLYGWISDNGDPDNILYTLLSSSQIKSGLNTTGYRNSELDMLLVKAQQEFDPVLREQLYRKALTIINKDVPLFALNHSLRFTATAPQVEGFQPHSAGYSVLNNITKVS